LDTKYGKREKIYFLPGGDLNGIQKRINKLLLIKKYKQEMEKMCIPI